MTRLERVQVVSFLAPGEQWVTSNEKLHTDLWSHLSGRQTAGTQTFTWYIARSGPAVVGGSPQHGLAFPRKWWKGPLLLFRPLR